MIDNVSLCTPVSLNDQPAITAGSAINRSINRYAVIALDLDGYVSLSLLRSPVGLSTCAVTPRIILLGIDKSLICPLEDLLPTASLLYAST